MCDIRYWIFSQILDLILCVKDKRFNIIFYPLVVLCAIDTDFNTLSEIAAVTHKTFSILFPDILNSSGVLLDSSAVFLMIDIIYFSLSSVSECNYTILITILDSILRIDVFNVSILGNRFWRIEAKY